MTPDIAKLPPHSRKRPVTFYRLQEQKTAQLRKEVTAMIIEQECARVKAMDADIFAALERDIAKAFDDGWFDEIPELSNPDFRATMGLAI